MELNSPSENATGDSQRPCSFRVSFPTHGAKLKLGYEKDKRTAIQPEWDHFPRITGPGGRGRWPSWLTVQPLSESSWWLRHLSHPRGFCSHSHQGPFPLPSPLQSTARCWCRDLSPGLLATTFCLFFSRVTFTLTRLREIPQLLLWDEPNRGIALLGNRRCETLSTTSWGLIYYVLKTAALYSRAAGVPAACLYSSPKHHRLWTVLAPLAVPLLGNPTYAPQSDTPTGVQVPQWTHSTHETILIPLKFCTSLSHFVLYCGSVYIHLISTNC